MGGFAMERGGLPIAVARGAQRLVAYIAIVDRPMTRSHVAGTLWPEVSERRAMGNLRSSLWRLTGAFGAPSNSGRAVGTAPCIVASGAELTLARNVDVDVHLLSETAHRLIDGSTAATSASVDDLVAADDLLPDWSDEWATIERERVRQLRLHALERLCRRLTGAGRYGRAIEVAQAVVASEPLRETAHRELIKVHLAEGNRAEAMRQYDAYGRLIRDELGLEPAFELAELLR
jgi:DNA-binding SARP family transcriptional activator